MPGFVSPLKPPAPDPGQRPRTKPKSARRSLRKALIPMAIGTVIAIGLGSAPLVIAAAVVWLFWIMRYMLLTQVLDPDGSSTPYVNQHSDIQAMVARGEYAKASEAYQTAIATDPGDVVACEHLGQLALNELKNYDLALLGYREAERRATEPRRKLGYALQLVGICRERLNDPGKTMVELRRVLACYPDAPNAATLRAELDEIKARWFRESRG